MASPRGQTWEHAPAPKTIVEGLIRVATAWAKGKIPGPVRQRHCLKSRSPGDMDCLYCLSCKFISSPGLSLHLYYQPTSLSSIFPPGELPTAASSRSAPFLQPSTHQLARPLSTSDNRPILQLLFSSTQRILSAEVKTSSSTMWDRFDNEIVIETGISSSSTERGGHALLLSLSHERQKTDHPVIIYGTPISSAISLSRRELSEGQTSWPDAPAPILAVEALITSTLSTSSSPMLLRIGDPSIYAMQRLYDTISCFVIIHVVSFR
ncbi:hypothetical protein M409DRAFT_53606 [Zasmidium cellare ATCC 36951]|uniref:Uncharacterized protein n=1 Tax=Zasmidium cellare ATCC 36951 TaxID=1080233 RepID=A0A6A6CRB6_ZASCE|nr:uncharacterized protein M409DRAFT_53606 [Zasmidium cellare ATCC 36951]KAF2168329.1 hypothetical protein M409DRAFT_53606 [Zasmidium cellare ATCC 36951]